MSMSLCRRGCFVLFVLFAAPWSATSQAIPISLPPGSIVIQPASRVPQNQPVELVSGEVNRFFLVPKVLSPETFFIERPGVGRFYINVPKKIDLHEWMDAFDGRPMSIWMTEDRNYEFRDGERGVRAVLDAAVNPSRPAPNYFLGNTGIVLVMERKDGAKGFLERKRVTDVLNSFTQREVMLIFRPETAPREDRILASGGDR